MRHANTAFFGIDRCISMGARILTVLLVLLASDISRKPLEYLSSR